MMAQSTMRPRQGVIAVIARSSKLLVIRRSALVRAPRMLCFPGGGIEFGENEPTALRRELMEELHLPAQPVRCLWRSRAPSGVLLAWWQATIPPHSAPRPFPDEVESVYWMTPGELRSAEDVLETNRAFLDFIEQRAGGWETALQLPGTNRDGEAEESRLKPRHRTG